MLKVQKKFAVVGPIGEPLIIWTAGELFLLPSAIGVFSVDLKHPAAIRGKRNLAAIRRPGRVRIDVCAEGQAREYGAGEFKQPKIQTGYAHQSAENCSLVVRCLGQAKIEKLHCAAGSDLDIGQLPIAMNHVSFVGVLQRIRDLQSNFLEGHRTF